MEIKRLRAIRLFFSNMRPGARKLLLSFGGVCALIVFFLLPPYREWANDRIVAYYNEFAGQKNKMGAGQRMTARFEGSYTYSKQIAGFFDRKGHKASALVLVPPSDYFEKAGIEYHVPEPAVLYYYTGLKTLWPNSHNAADANWYAHVKGGEIVVDSITDRHSFEDTLNALKKFDISL